MASALNKKILVISEKGIGDALTLTPVLGELKRVKPEIEIDFLAPGLQRLAGSFEQIANFLDKDIVEGKSRSELAAWLTQQNYDWVWNTQNEKSPWRKPIAEAENPNWLSAPPHRQWPKRQVVKLRLEQLRHLFPDLKQADNPRIKLIPSQNQEQVDFSKKLAGYQFSIAIQPWGKDPNKIWAIEKYRELIRKLSERLSICIVLFLSPDEEDLFGKDYLPNLPNLIRISEPLEAVVPKLAACKIFIGNDSGFYHLAHALGLRVVGIYRTWGGRKIWSYRTDRSHALCFFLPKVLRKYWRSFISVKRVLGAVDSLCK